MNCSSLFQATNAKTGTTDTSGTTLPKICGINDEEHMYVDAGTGTTSEAILEAVLTGTTTSRTWKIKVKSLLMLYQDKSFHQVSQIPCDSRVKPQDGCMQYHTGITGQVSQEVGQTFLFSSSRFGLSTSGQLPATIYIWPVTIIRCKLFL